jgi:hypothetical protein
MAYEYKLSPIDISGAIKYVQDNAFKQEQLRLKYEESINKSVDDQYKLYNGKVRKQDVSEFDALFSEYANAQKRYQSLNRSGGKRDELTQAGVDAEMYRNKMLAYVKDSSGWGATQGGMGKIYKDPNKLVNRKKYDEAWMNMSSMTTNELNQTYGGIDKFPTDFDFKEEDYGPEEVMKFSRAIKQTLPISAPNAIKEMPVIDPATGQQKLVKREISFNNMKMVVDVPVNTVKAGIDPSVALNSVIMNSATDQNTLTYLKAIKKKIFDSAANAQDPQSQKDSEAQIQRAMQVYGIKDRTQVNEYHIFASNFVDQNRMGEVEIEDWNRLDDYASMFAKANGLKLDALQMKNLKKQISSSNSDMSITTLNKLLTMYKTARDTGLTSVDEWLPTIEGVFKKFNLPMSRDIITKASQGIAIQAQDFQNLYWNGVGGNPPGQNPAVKGKRPSSSGSTKK